jgi:glycosyltransferase involved in cell wall biosynthesis
MNDQIGRVAVLADDAGALAQTLAQLGARGVAGYELEVIGTDALSDRRYDLVHVCSPVPALRTALPVVGSVHAAVSRFYAQCRIVLSPSRAVDAALEAHGVAPERILRWSLGVDPSVFHPAGYAPEVLPDAFNVLYVGPLAREHGVDLLAEAFLAARDRDPRLHLVLVGSGLEERRLRSRLGSAATFLGALRDEELARVYATADLLMSPSRTDALGQVVLEAQASGLPVLAVDAGGPAELIESGRSGCLVAPDADTIAGAIRGLARRGALRDRLATGGLLAVREHTWERSLAELAAGYAAARAAVRGPEVARAA